MTAIGLDLSTLFFFGKSRCFPLNPQKVKLFAGFNTNHVCLPFSTTDPSFCFKLHKALGQNQWYHFGVGEFTTHFRTYFSGWIESDVHRGLTDLAFDPWPQEAYWSCMPCPRPGQEQRLRPGLQPGTGLKSSACWAVAHREVGMGQSFTTCGRQVLVYFCIYQC